jgi:hypothetical protein
MFGLRSVKSFWPLCGLLFIACAPTVQGGGGTYIGKIADAQSLSDVTKTDATAQDALDDADGAASSCQAFTPYDAVQFDAANANELGKFCPMGCNLSFCAETTSTECANHICVWDGPSSSSHCSIPCTDTCPAGYICRKAQNASASYCFQDTDKFFPDLGKPCPGNTCASDSTNCAKLTDACQYKLCANHTGNTTSICSSPCDPAKGCPCGMHCAKVDWGGPEYMCFPDGAECKIDADCAKKPHDFCSFATCQWGACVFTPDDGTTPDGICKAPDPCHQTLCHNASKTCEVFERNCDDKSACTTDSCDVGNGTCVHTPIANCCGDGKCTGSENKGNCVIDCVQGSGTCAYRCGQSPAGGCNCADTCANDPTGCCPDYDAACGGDSTLSCVGRCGQPFLGGVNECDCLDTCATNPNGCCADYIGACVAAKPVCQPSDPCYGTCKSATPSGAKCTCNPMDINGMFLPKCASFATCCI